jgi:hypothetical protein
LTRQKRQHQAGQCIRPLQRGASLIVSFSLSDPRTQAARVGAQSEANGYFAVRAA